MSQKPYEEQFIRGIANLFDQAGVRYELVCQPGEPLRPLIKGSSNSEADGGIEIGSGFIFVEIAKKDYASDSVVKYHRALSLGLLTREISGQHLALVHAFITKNMKPLRVQNARHMGGLLNRDFGVTYLSAETEDENIPELIDQFREPLLSFARREGALPSKNRIVGEKA